MASKSGYMKDALILFAITLISGLCLGFVYDITLIPRQQAVIAANNKTYAQVLPAASSFTEVEGSADMIAATAEEIAGLGFGSVAIESVLIGTDASGKEVGCVINSLSKNSYGGPVKLSIGFDEYDTITGVGIRKIEDTPGLGLKAKEPKFLDQYMGKNAEKLEVTKTGAHDAHQIDAISGATVTSNAVTNAVNAALYYLHNYMN